MKISEKRENALYAAIYDPITDLRVEIGLRPLELTPSMIDSKLHALESIIWRKVEEALKLEADNG